MKGGNFLRGFIIGLLLLSSMPLLSQSAFYMYRVFRPEGCSVRYNVSANNDRYYVIVTVYSDNLRLLNDPEMQIRTYDDKLLEFKGEKIDSSVLVEGSSSGYSSYVSSTNVSSAQFHLTDDEFKMLNSGVKKVRISTYPYEHKRTFKKDKIGKTLYEAYVAMKDSEDDF